jgi:Ras-related protein Rab-32
LQFKNVLVRLQLWDIAGQERFGAMTHVYYKEAVGAIVAFDSTRPDTFESVLKWKNDLDDKIALPDDSPIPVLLLATKCDLVSGTDSDATSGLSQTNAKLATFVTEHKFAGHAMISSKTGLGVDAAAKFLVQHIVDATAR